jgi:hypothetical protein
MAGKRKKSAFVTHKIAGTHALRRRSQSPPVVKRRHLNFGCKNVGNVSVSESLSIAKQDTKPTKDSFQGAEDQWVNQDESVADPAYQEFLGGMNEASITKTRQAEVCAYH